MIRAALIFFGVFLCLVAQAAETKILQAQTLVVVLHDKQMASAMERQVRVRETSTGKIAQLTLQKINSSDSWSGFFVIQFFVGDNSSKTLEFLDSRFKPYLVYSGTSGAEINLFTEPKEMAQFIQKTQPEAGKIDFANIGNLPKTASVLPPEVKILPSAAAAAVAPSALHVTAGMDKGAIESQVRQQAKAQEQHQMSLEEQQARARAELLARQESLSAAEKKRKKDQATALVAEANALYAKQNYGAAEAKYKEAIGLDPEEEVYYYRYGVSLYKNEKYNESLAALSMAEVSGASALEKDYYTALNHLKLKDYDKAHKEFIEIRDENDPTLSPTAAFFAGNIEFQQLKFPAARKSMEYTIDNSNDPKLANSAETLLEQIDKSEAYYDRKKEKYRVTLFGGLIYDSNILNVAENNVATDVKSFRLNYGASFLAILHRTQKSDLGAQISVSDYYSSNTSFIGDAFLQTADPLETTFSVPFHYEIQMKDKALGWELAPYYKNTFMAPSGGTRELVISSFGLNTTLAWALSSDWFLSNRLDYSADNSYLSSAADDDQSSQRFGLTISPTKLLDLKGEESITTDVILYKNQAQGKNNTYNKYGLGVSYAFPFWMASQGNLRAEYANQPYTEATSAHTDQLLTVVASATKDIRKDLNFLASVMFQNSASDLDAYNYNKIVVTGLFTYTSSFLQK